MLESKGAPPLLWLFNSGERRRHAVRYWFKDTGVGLLNLGIHYGFRLLPISMCSALGAALGAVAKFRYSESDARARKAWQRLRHTEADEASTNAAMRRLWRNVGRTMAEYSVLDRMWKSGRIAIEGGEHIHTARANQKPILIAAVHLANWEVIGPALAALGQRGSGFYEPPENRFDHYIAVNARLRYGAKLIFPTHAGGRTALRLLSEKKDEVFVVYVDEIFRGQVSAPAFGRKRKPDGNIAYVVRLARLTGAAIVPAYCIRLGSAHFKVTFLPPVEIVRTSNAAADLAANVAALDHVFAPVVCAHLEQWYYALDFEFDD